jgi:hypothetical protein
LNIQYFGFGSFKVDSLFEIMSHLQNITHFRLIIDTDESSDEMYFDTFIQTACELYCNSLVEITTNTLFDFNLLNNSQSSLSIKYTLTGNNQVSNEQIQAWWAASPSVVNEFSVTDCANFTGW